MTERARVLIIDPDSTCRARVREALSENGYLLDEAPEEEEGLRKVSRFGPDLVLLDVDIPVPAHRMLCRELQEKSPNPNLRTIMLTSETDCARTLECLDSGAHDFLIKPFRHSDLLARVELQLQTKKRLDALVREKEELCLIQSLIHTLYEKKSIYDLLYTLVRKIAETIQMERCSFVRIRGDRRTGVVEASSDGPNVRGLEIDLRKYPEITEVLKTARPLIIQDIGTDAIMAPVRSYLEKIRFQSLVLIPVTGEEEIVGTLLLRTARPGKSFSESEIHFLEAIAEAARPAILNAHLFEAMEHRIFGEGADAEIPGDDGSDYQGVLEDRAKAMMEKCFRLQEEVRRLKGLQEEIRGHSQHRPRK